jgi:arginine-tRNA-protein transferase
MTELVGDDATSLYNDLSRGGFRRSHHLAYRPACAGCQACIPVRIVAPELVLTRSLRRIGARGGDISARVGEPRASFEHYRMFVRYQNARHRGSEMAAMTYGDFRAMIEDSPIATRLVELRGPGSMLLAACLIDVLDDGLSAVYSYYEPHAGKRSLGTLIVLMLAEEAKRRNLPYIYLGYWVADSPKMTYKARFRPLEGLGPNGWRRLELAAVMPPRAAPADAGSGRSIASSASPARRSGRGADAGRRNRPDPSADPG